MPAVTGSVTDFPVLLSVSVTVFSEAWLSAIGELYTCLFGVHGRDLRTPLRSGASDDELRALLSGIWAARDDRYSEQRGEETAHRRGDADGKVEMSYIGG